MLAGVTYDRTYNFDDPAHVALLSLTKAVKNEKNIIFFPQDAKKTEEHNVVILVDFAIALMQTLDTINRESFQRFRLRMGLNHGPVIAGVIGNIAALLTDTVNANAASISLVQ